MPSLPLPCNSLMDSSLNCKIILLRGCIKQSKMANFIRVAPTEVNISSSPSSYGVEGQQVVLTCEFPPDIGVQFTVLWRFNGDIMGEGNVTITINSFQLFNEGCYSCVVSTEYWNISSVDLCLKMAGMF